MIMMAQLSLSCHLLTTEALWYDTWRILGVEYARPSCWSILEYDPQILSTLMIVWPGTTAVLWGQPLNLNKRVNSQQRILIKVLSTSRRIATILLFRWHQFPCLKILWCLLLIRFVVDWRRIKTILFKNCSLHFLLLLLYIIKSYFIVIKLSMASNLPIAKILFKFTILIIFILIQCLV